ncbi:hypothetical protein KVV02_002538 [Mortierella alpina]|uniref:Guanylate cyclase domain-containing protein n=1 Tax=Mortierella alpina TaxID=64518 RepID=A0A9P8A314_MORAP|nr:hypothetical protein KVV02_002538 [Mortierella alpina]
MPIAYNQFAAVLMVDIVGFSQMTSIASSKGDVGAEMLSSQIGAYFDMAIRIIEYHGGDVVKFLGDALLVVFQTDPDTGRIYHDDSFSQTSSLDPLSLADDDPAAFLRRNKLTVRKAVECGLELLARLSNYRIYLSEYEFSRKLSGVSSGSDDNKGDDGINSSNTLASAPNGAHTRNGGSGLFYNGLGMTSISSESEGLNAGVNGAASATNLKSRSRRSSDNTDTNHHNSSPKPDGPTRAATHLGNPTPPDSPSGGRFIAGTGPGLGGVPIFNVQPPSAPSSNNNSVPSLHSTQATPGGVAGFLRREGSINSLSTKPASTTSKTRAGNFLANAKNLFTHANGNDRHRGAVMMPDDATATDDSHDLQLHMALSAGDISNIIVGDIGADNGLDNFLVQDTGRLEYAICGEQMATLEDALNTARAGEVTVTKSAWKYVNQDLYPFSEPRKNCFILKCSEPNICADLPLMRRVRNEKLFSAPMESNPHYYKYVNKSAIHRLILYPDNTFPAQFRNSTILFVSLGDVKPWTPEGLALCQKSMLVVNKILLSIGTNPVGFIQQFAVDDKGATILCAFGLPYPRSHENEAVFAAKSAWMIRQRFLDEKIEGFRISLATGVIFTSMIGNEFRRDPAIVGDTIVVAVRILKVEYALESIVCDDATMSACISDHDGLCQFEEMGEEYVKGKVHPLTIWRLVHFGAKKQTRRPEDEMVDETIGYEPERERVSGFIKTWTEEPDQNTIMVTGPRGSGKSMFYKQIRHIADGNGYQMCSAASLEVEKNTEYYPIKFLLLGLFDIMRKHDIPYATRNFDHAVAPMFSNYQAAGVAPKSFSIDRTNTTVSTGTAMTDITAIENMSLPTNTADGLSPTNTSINDRRRSSAFSADLAFSPTISQYEEPSARRSTSMTKLQAFINVCLAKTGCYGDANMSMPVLNRIVCKISSDNSTPIVDEHDDEILAEFIVRVLNYASTFVKIIVMFEDIQWCDPKSLGVIKAIHSRCREVLVVLFSRPQRDYGFVDLINGIVKHPKHLEIALEGLKRKEIELALIRAFQPNGVTRISPDVIELVQQRTQGNPKFVKNMSNILKEFYHVNIVDGELLTTGQEPSASPCSKTVEEMLITQDRKKMTLMQYDRLRPKFQDFLKIASCLGEQFSLAEVSAIKPLETLLDKPEPGKTYATLLSDMDTYRFLSMTTDQQKNLQFSSNVVLQTIYSFTSDSIAKDIYDSIPYEERVAYHLKMGQFYESFLECSVDDDPTAQPLNCQDLLPQITHHYLKTDHTEKKIKYLKALSAFELKSNMLADTTQNLTELIRILDTERGARDLVSQEDMADIYGMKGESLSKRMRIEEAEPALLDSLSRYGITWPTTKQQWRVDLNKQWFKFWFNYHRGATPIRLKPTQDVLKARVEGKDQIRFRRIIRVLSCLQNIFFWKTQPEAAMLSSLYTLDYSRKLGLSSGDQTASLGRIALLLYFQGKKRQCEKYMSESRLMNQEGETTEGMLPSMDAYVEYSEGRHVEAHRLLDEAINESKTFGVVSNLATFYRAVTMKTAYRMWEGAFNVHPEDCRLLRALSAVAIQNGDSEGETLFAIPTLANLLLQDRLRDAESWVLLIEKFIMPKARLMNLLIVHGILAFYYAKVGNYEKSRIYVELQAERMIEQGIGAHPFPLMSCMFSLMAMYEMHDNARPRSAVGSCAVSSACQSVSSFEMNGMCPARGFVILERIMGYLKSDPFKPVADAYMCLADAMRSLILLGHEKEGAQKLITGYRNLSPALEGIHFVDAYFLTQVGRHAGDPETKSTYYKKAHGLFLAMSMDPLVWLTDPSPNWVPPPIEQGRFDFILGDIPVPTDDAVLTEGSLGWAAAEVSSAVTGTATAGMVPAVLAASVPTEQDWAIGREMRFRNVMAMDANKYERELATASRSMVPTVHNVGEGTTGYVATEERPTAPAVNATFM